MKRVKLSGPTTMVKSKAVPKKKSSKRKFGLTKNLSFYSTGFPRQMKMRMKYIDQIQLTYTAGAGSVVTYHTFSCNGLYDPNISGTGHQPLYFDSVMGVYEHYTVESSWIKIRATNENAQNALAGIAITSGSSVVSTNPTNLMEQPDTVFKMFNYDAGNEVVMFRRWDSKSFFGPNALANDNLQGTGAANPAEQSYYQVWLCNADLTESVSVNFVVEIVYYAIFDELKQIAAS